MSNIYPNIQKHYIIGIGRSGTTLLSKLLNQHKNCLVTLETDFVIFFYHSFKDKTNFTKDDYELIANYFNIFFKLNPTIEPYFNNANLLEDLDSANIKSYQALIDFIYFRFNYLYKPSQDIRVIVDKKPSYSLHVDDLLKLNPDSKFIYLVRDYRANILSRKQSIERRIPNTAFNAYRWLFFNKKIGDFKHYFPNKILEIKYEDLVTDTATTLHKIIAFLNLSTTEADVTFYKNIESNSSPIETNNPQLNQRIQKTKDNLGKPVFTSRIDAWKVELSQQDIEISEAICGNYAQSLGYSRTANLNAFKKCIYKIKNIGNYLKALYDYRKEFILIQLKAETKLNRLRSKYKF